jgi:hypothetical protein
VAEVDHVCAGGDAHTRLSGWKPVGERACETQPSNRQVACCDGGRRFVFAAPASPFAAPPLAAAPHGSLAEAPHGSLHSGAAAFRRRQSAPHVGGNRAGNSLAAEESNTEHGERERAADRQRFACQQPQTHARCAPAR